MKKVHSLYFSPTLTTRKVVSAIASSLAAELSLETEGHDVTTPASRTARLSFDKDDIVVFGCPVYIGRVPNLIKPYLETIEGNGAIGVPVVVFGNRNFDDALVELYDMMMAEGFRCIAAAAFVGEHSFSRKLGGGRPDEADLKTAADFGKKAAAAAMALGDGTPEKMDIPGNRPYRFFKAVDDEGKPFDIRKVKPVTSKELCCNCGQCARMCPMGAIDLDDCSSVSGICIKCGACIKRCPVGAKSISDTEYLRHLAILERDQMDRKEPVIYTGCESA